jgi:ornithine cyclodeaminase
MTLDILTGEAVRNCVSMEACIDLMASTMIAVSRGEATLPQRSFVDLEEPGNAFLVMPGAAGRPPAFGSKLLSLFPRNSTLPAIQGLIVVFDAVDGGPIAVVDAASVTCAEDGRGERHGDARTLGARGRDDAGDSGLGVQAESHLDAMRAVRPLERVLVWGRSKDKAEAFVERNRARAGIEIVVASDVKSAVEQADIVCTVTGSPSPILEGRWLRPGTHLNLVGAYTATTREVDTEAIRRARLFVEIREFALREAGRAADPDRQRGH